MRRREFIATLGGAAAWPMVARGQQNKVWRIGYLHPGFLDTPMDAALFEAFRQQLRDLGYIDGKNLIIDQRAAETHAERLPVWPMSLSRFIQTHLLLWGARGCSSAASYLNDVLTAVSDPVGAGFVKSLAHPGGNITGLSLAEPRANRHARRGGGTPKQEFVGDCAGDRPSFSV